MIFVSWLERWRSELIDNVANVLHVDLIDISTSTTISTLLFAFDVSCITAFWTNNNNNSTWHVGRDIVSLTSHLAISPKSSNMFSILYKSSSVSGLFQDWSGFHFAFYRNFEICGQCFWLSVFIFFLILFFGFGILVCVCLCFYFITAHLWCTMCCLTGEIKIIYCTLASKFEQLREFTKHKLTVARSCFRFTVVLFGAFVLFARRRGSWRW